MPTVKLTGIIDNPTLLASSLVRGTDENKPVKITANKTAGLAGNLEPFYGIIETISEDQVVCVVKKRGIVTCPYSGSLALGLKNLAADGAGGVKEGASSAPKYWVLDVDSTNTLVTFDLG